MERLGMVGQSSLKLASDGIFPIIWDKDGNRLPELPASGFDFPGTIQGEGKLNGIPSLFIRLAGCNLDCCWKTDGGQLSVCDTSYAVKDGKTSDILPVDDAFAIIRNNLEKIRHLVITGGEPFLQSEPLRILLNRVKRELSCHLTTETNATLFDPELAACIDFFSLSPKLQSSANGRTTSNVLRINPQVIQAFITHARTYGKDFQLKFVCAAENDIAEIHSLLEKLSGWENDDILLMPLGGTATEMHRNISRTLQHCIRNGWRYCDRLHISLFGAKAGI